jgi:hypothetical protein
MIASTWLAAGERTAGAYPIASTVKSRIPDLKIIAIAPATAVNLVYKMRYCGHKT